MKIFKTIQKQLAILGTSASHQSPQKNPLKRRVFFGFLILGCAFVSRSIPIFYAANGFMDYMECICTASATIILFACFITIVLKRILFFESMEKIEKLIDTRCEFVKAKKLFMKSNRQVERLSGLIFMVLLKIAIQFYMLPKFIVSFAIYFATDSGSDSFELPVPMWFPFDWKNPIGYLIAIILEYIDIAYEYFIFACTLAIGIGALWFSISITNEIERILHLINDKAQVNKHKSNELRILFTEFIDAHGILKQVEYDLADSFQPVIMLLFIWSLLAISGVMLIIQKEILHHENVLPVFLLILSGILAFALVFIVCELGQRMSDSFHGINVTLNEFDWYLFPIEKQRMLPMIIAYAQQPVLLECFGSIACTRKDFKKVIHCAFSYFMVLRQLSD